MVVNGEHTVWTFMPAMTVQGAPTDSYINVVAVGHTPVEYILRVRAEPLASDVAQLSEKFSC
jgi:hypothetical protein